MYKKEYLNEIIKPLEDKVKPNKNNQSELKQENNWWKSILMWLFSTAYGLGDKKITGHLPTKYTKNYFHNNFNYIYTKHSLYIRVGVFI